MTGPLSRVIIRRENAASVKLTQLVRYPTGAELREHGERFRCVPNPELLRACRSFTARWCEVVDRHAGIVRVIDLLVAWKEYGRKAAENPGTRPQQVPKAAREVHISTLYRVEVL